MRDIRRWLEHTPNLLHVSILLFVPLLIGIVTILSNWIAASVFLLFPPLASGTYTLFADPEGKYSSPRKFIGGMTIGGLSGWLAIELTTRLWYVTPPGRFRVHAGAAAFGVFLTGVLTWGLDLEEPSSFSTALLVLLFAGRTSMNIGGLVISRGIIYVFGIFASSSLVAATFSLWRDRIYARRARYLYETVRGDDHVLIPVRGGAVETVVKFGATIAAAHAAGKVVLLDVVDNESVAKRERDLLDRVTTHGLGDAVFDSDNAHWESEWDNVTDAVERLERAATEIETKFDIPCDVVVAAGEGSQRGRIVSETARETNCDLIVTPYEISEGRLSPFVRTLFGGQIDVIAFRNSGEQSDWQRILVPVRGGGQYAHAMIDFALRISGRSGRVSVCHCIEREAERRAAEEMLTRLVETFGGQLETRVANQPVTDFIDDNAPHFDLTLIGASTDRSATSRFISRPTFERISSVDCDVAVVHRSR